jgi:hypothetical protein
MKFISKSANLLIVLSPGLQAQPLTGTPAKPTISVRFKDGVAEVHQQELIDMMLNHPAFNGDFISADDIKRDPYAETRRASEPAHILKEMKYGTPVSRQVVGGDSSFSNLPLEMQKTVKTLAAEIAKSMLPEMVENALKSIVAVHQASPAGLTKAGKPKGRPGRKPTAKAPEVVVPQTVEPIVENSSTQV